ncbi:YecR-like lipofamily protein [Lonsdalea populi]|uniref:YecR-like lipofamily protein n=1 Tax=Lonsdalea populi TaxID=1172565 RepID=UPI0021AC0F12|nr:YecR-like lipofamily protein [Lonsdalea populi]
MQNKLMAILFFTLLISGCLTTKELIPTGGSKADGTVRMGYSFGMFESPVIDPKQGMTLAKARCAAWSYSGAEPLEDSLLNVRNPHIQAVCRRQ